MQYHRRPTLGLAVLMGHPSETVLVLEHLLQPLYFLPNSLYVDFDEKSASNRVAIPSSKNSLTVLFLESHSLEEASSTRSLSGLAASPPCSRSLSKLTTSLAHSSPSCRRYFWTCMFAASSDKKKGQQNMKSLL
jgi:hypothetical protein